MKIILFLFVNQLSYFVNSLNVQLYKGETIEKYEKLQDIKKIQPSFG